MVYKRESPKVDHHEVISGSSISGLPDDVLVHILGFMNPKEAVQTSVLSKRWKHLCKQLTELTYSTKLCPRDGCKRFQKFADWILCSRNHSCSLFNLNVVFCLTIDPQILETLIEYAFSHSLHHLKLDLVKGSKWHFRPNPLTFRCHSLKSLTLCHDWPPCNVLLPEKLNFPSLQSLRLENFEFAASCCGSAEPFSNCHALHTLILERCYNPAVLNISNSTLTNLTISNVYSRQIVLSTPNLSSFSIEGYIDQPLFSTCSLSLLREVYIELCLIRDDPEDLKDLSTVMKWLQVLTNVKILTFHFRATYLMLKKLPNPINMAPQPPSFVRLEAVRLKSTLSETEELLNTVVEYLLQNSPMNKVDILKGS